MTEAEKRELIKKCDNAIYGMCTTAFKPYLCQSISRAINSMPVTPSVSEIFDKISAEIKEKSFTEEIFDECVFCSTYTENTTREVAENESVVETEIVRVYDVLEILEKYKGAANETF